MRKSKPKLYLNTSKLKGTLDRRTYRAMPVPMQRRFANLAKWYMSEKMGVEITPLQIEFCDFLQRGWGDPSVPRLALCYRGFGKTTILKLFQAWYLESYPFEQVLFITNSDGAIKNCGGAILSFIKKIPFFSQLKLTAEDSEIKSFSQFHFNVKGKRDIEGSSWKGITYSTRDITGLRASLIVGDDWETIKEAGSEPVFRLQQRIATELWSVQADDKPHWSKIFTGTLHSEYGIWSELQANYDVRCRIYPALYPDLEADNRDYLKKISPKILKQLKENPDLSGKSTDRLGETALKKKPGGTSSDSFRMQFMLDASKGLESAYPLKCKDLIVIEGGIDHERLPTNLHWGTLPNDKLKLYCPAGGEDAFYGPRYEPQTYGEIEYNKPEHKIIYVDPSSYGPDEQVWIYGATCKGKIYILDMGAHRTEDLGVRFEQTVEACRTHDVRTIYIEVNTGNASVPLIQGIAKNLDIPLKVIGISSYQKKEKRVINSLGDLLSQHKIVVDADFIRKDRMLSKGDITRRLFYQLPKARSQSNLGLRFDDRLDALSGLCTQLAKSVQYSAAPQAKTEKELWALAQKRWLDKINDEEVKEYGGTNSFQRMMKKHRTGRW